MAHAVPFIYYDIILKCIMEYYIVRATEPNSTYDHKLLELEKKQKKKKSKTTPI